MASRKAFIVGSLVVAACGLSIALMATHAVPGVVAPAPTAGQQGLAMQAGVRGHWTIEVKHANGTPDKQVEFDNAFADLGNVLVRILNREITAGDWSLGIDGSSDTTDLCALNGNRAACTVAEPTMPSTAFESTITRSLLTAASNHNIHMTGHFTAAFDGNIGRVSSLKRACESTVAPADCHSTLQQGITALTTHNLATPIAVSAGQWIGVTFDLRVDPGVVFADLDDKLVRILNRELTPGDWGLGLVNTPCAPGGTDQQRCVVVERPNPNVTYGPDYYTNLAVTTQPHSVAFRGGFPSQVADYEDSIGIIKGVCPPTVKPMDCYFTDVSGWWFHMAFLSPGVNISAGQYVDLNGTLNFVAQ